MKKKIIFFYPLIKNDGLKSTYESYNSFLKSKFKVEIFSLYKFNEKKVSVFYQNLINILKIISKLLKHEKEHIFFSLNSHYFLHFFKILGLKFKLVSRIPNPVDINPPFFPSFNAGHKLSRLEIFLLRYSDKVIIYSKKNFDLLKKKYKLKNLELIRNYFPKKNVKLKKRKIRNLFFVGRFVESKNPIFFLKCCLKLLKNLDIKIHFVGHGHLKEKLKELSKDFKKKVIFHEFVRYPFKKFHKKIDLFCLTSLFDGTPNVLGEAISYKIPCIAPKNVGSSNELLNNGKCGTLFLSNNSQSFMKEIKSIISNSKKLQSKTLKAYKSLEKYNKENTLKKLEKVINVL